VRIVAAEYLSLEVRDYHVTCIANPTGSGTWEAEVLIEKATEISSQIPHGVRRVIPVLFDSPRSAVNAAVDLAHSFVYRRSDK
jgi:hypothetical protein